MPSPNVNHLRMMELAHQQQQQQQQQQWMSSMEAAWAVGAGGASAAAPAALADSIGGGHTPWNMEAAWGGYASALTQPVLPLDDVMGTAVASASESIIRSLLQQQPLPATQALGDILIPPPLQHLPPQAKSAFFRRATMLARNAGAAAAAAAAAAARAIITSLSSRLPSPGSQPVEALQLLSDRLASGLGVDPGSTARAIN
jgi:hypothetical protein